MKYVSQLKEVQEFVPFAGYYERVKILSELYTNISDWFEEVE